MTLESWKEKIYAGLVNLQARKEQLQAKTIYGLIAGSAFWPVIQAAQTGDWAALAALGTVAGGLGGGLLANKVQDWKDKVSGEEDVVALIQQEIESSVDFRQAIDEVLESLEVFKEAESRQKTDEEKAWFTQVLREELGGMGNLGRFEVHLTLDDGAEKKAQNARTRYLKNFSRECLLLPLTTLGDQISITEDVTLDKIYISLNTRTRLDKSGKKEPLAAGAEPDDGFDESQIKEDKDLKLLAAQDAAKQNSRLVLLGDPGSGKSTFVKQYLAGVAKMLIEHPEREGGLTPLLVILRDLVPRLQHLKLEKQDTGNRRRLLATLVKEQMLLDLETTYMALDFAAGLEEVLTSGKSVIAFDGLDEVPQHLRALVRETVHAVLKTYQVARCMITSRIRSYRGKAVFDDFVAHTLAPLNTQQIQDFAGAWYKAQADIGRVARSEVESRTKSLQEAASNESIRLLARNPMLLMTLTMVHQQKARLPKERVVLYDEAVDLMASRWQTEKGEAPFMAYPALRDFVEDKQQVRGVMEQLAYEAHRAGRNKKTADLSREEALKILEEAFAQLPTDGPRDFGLPAAFLDYVDQRSGLLIGRGGEEESKQPSNYSFPHRTFQEYLAGCYVVTHRDKRKLLPQLAGEDDYWSVAVQMGAEDLIYNRRMSNTLLEFSMQLCPNKCTQQQDARCALWAGKMVAEIGVSVVKDDKGGAESGVAFLGRLRKKLVLCLKSRLPPIERAEAGIVLAQLGDPRKTVMQAKEMEFFQVPAGPFWMGSGDDDDLAQDREKPLHEVNLTYPYWISRYPVTVAQYKQYMDDTGAAAGDEDTLAGPVNHPVQSVNWQEAQDFCVWLTTLLQHEASVRLKNKKLSPEARERWEMLRAGRLVAGLPSEAEWEKAARGVQDTRRYPWGHKADPDKMNFSESGIGTRSTVGCFFHGKSACGAEDMSGNVLEWSRDWFDSSLYANRKLKVKDPEGPSSGEYRVLRGGAFYYSRRGVRCAYRDSGGPFGRGYGVGFRVVLLPYSER